MRLAGGRFWSPFPSMNHLSSGTWHQRPREGCGEVVIICARWSFPVQIQGVIHIGSHRLSEFRFIIGDGHQPNSRGLYTSYKDSLLKVGWVYPQYKDFRPWHISSGKDHMGPTVHGKFLENYRLILVIFWWDRCEFPGISSDIPRIWWGEFLVDFGKAQLTLARQ